MIWESSEHRPVESHSRRSLLRCVPIIVVQQSAKPFATLDFAIDAADLLARFNQAIAKALVVPFP